jgi:enoyl-[acyl-carrier protein] reductase I
MLQATSQLGGKKGLVVGIANEHSVAAGCARAFTKAGAELAVIYLNDKARAYIAERLIGTLRGERLDQMNIFSKRHLRQIFPPMQRITITRA